MRNSTSEFLTAKLRNFRGVNFAIDIVRVVNISCASHVISKQGEKYHTPLPTNCSAPAIALTRAQAMTSGWSCFAVRKLSYL